MDYLVNQDGINNLFDSKTHTEIIDRINQLSEQSERQWGKMNVSQMLAHCKEAFKVPLRNKPIPRMFIGRIFGWMAKGKLYDEKPWGKNLPTAPNFIIQDERDFEIEKSALLELIKQFYTLGPDGVGHFPHPFFGTLTKEQWGKSMWKHIDHHLKQFGV